MKKIIYFILIFVVGFFATTTNVSADDTVLYVDAGAEESIADGSATHPYKTIQRAIDEAEEGNTIIVASGEYYETLEIYTKGLTLKGAYSGVKGEEGRTNPTKVMFPDAIANTLTINLLYVDAEDVTIDGFDFVNIVEDVSAHTGTWAPIYLDRSDNFHFINNFVDVNTDFVTVRIVGSEGISKEAGHGGTLIEHNFIRGINGWSTLNLYGIGGTVKNNVIIGGSRGLQLQVINDTVGGEVSNNTITAYTTSVYHNYANRGSSSWNYSGNTLLRGEVNADFRASSGAPDYKHWTGFFIENFGAEHYPAVGMANVSPQLTVYNNVIDGVSKCELSREDFSEVVGVQFKGRIIADPDIQISDNELKFLTVGVINTAQHISSQASIPMFSLEQVPGNVFDDTNIFKGIASLDDTGRRIELEKYTVEFLDHESNTLKVEDNILFGECAVAPEIPARDGYNIIGWDKAFSEVREDLVISPVYELIRYTVTFVDKEGNVISSQEVLPGQSAIPPVPPVVVGYTFRDWDKAFDNITKALTVTALYDINTYEVIFLGKNGQELSRSTVEHGSSAIAPSAPTVDGFEFTGWDTDFSNVTAPLTVRAQYKAVKITPKPEEKHDGSLPKTGVGNTVIFNASLGLMAIGGSLLVFSLKKRKNA